MENRVLFTNRLHYGVIFIPMYIFKKKIALGFWSGFMIMGCQTAGSTLRLFTHLIPLKTLYLAYLT